MSKRPEEENEEADFSKTPGEETEEAFAPSSLANPTEQMIVPYQGQYEGLQLSFSGQELSTSRLTGTHSDQQQQQHLVPHPPLKVQRPGRPRIHPPKPVGISKPRGRPRGSKNKKPRKLAERPPKRPRGRPRKWPPEMWEGFQRSQFAAATHQAQQLQQQQQSQEMPGPSHLFYDEHVHPHLSPSEEEHLSTRSQPLMNVPYHHMASQQEPQELTHLMSPPHQHLMQQESPLGQQLHLHHPIHQHPHHQLQQHQEEQMLQIRPLYHHQQQQLEQQQQQQQREQEMMISQQQQQQSVYYHEQMQSLHHPPHTTS